MESVQAEFRLFRFFLALTAVTGWSLNCGAAPKNREDLPVTTEQAAERVIQALESRGFEVSRSYFMLYPLDDCKVSFEVMKSCYGNNPAAPYITFALLPREGGPTRRACCRRS